MTDRRIHPTIAELAAPIDSLVPYPRNPRQGDVGAISESLRINGQYRPVVANLRTNEVLAGNHTWKAALALGWTQIAVTWVDADEEEAARIVAVDNRSNDLATYDDAALVELLKSLPSLEGTLYDLDDLEELIAGLDTPLDLTGDPDDAPDLPAEDAPTITQPGDLWQLGPHRLLVGDSTDLDAVKRLFNGERAHCMWTDPPYGIDYVGGYSHQYSPKERLAMGGKTIKNDGELDLPALLTGFLTVATEVLRPGAAAYVSHPAGVLSMTFGQHILAAGWALRQQLIWVKDSLVMGRSDYHYRHEPIWLAYTPAGEGQGRLGRGGDAWHGNDSAQSVFEVARPKRSEQHPTMKPVALIQPMLANSCPRGQLVYDPFGGSGSTLIAAHSLGMHARLVELDCRYADVICRRFQEATDVVPVNVATGNGVDFTTGD